LSNLSTLRHRREFIAVNGGVRVAKPGFVLLGLARAEPNPQIEAGAIRFGLTATKRIGGAVERNRARRRLRALAASCLAELGKPGWDYVLIAREETLKRDYAQMAGELESALEMLHKARRTAGRKPGGQ
jgi:ribonuclease P protein component